MLITTYARLEDLLKDIPSDQAVNVGILNLPPRRGHANRPQRHLMVAVLGNISHCWHLNLTHDRNRSERMIQIATRYMRLKSPDLIIRHATPQFNRVQIEQVMEASTSKPDNLAALSWTDDKGNPISHLAYLTLHEARILSLYEHPKAGEDHREYPYLILKLHYDAWDRCLAKITGGTDECLTPIEEIRSHANYEKNEYDLRVASTLRQLAFEVR